MPETKKCSSCYSTLALSSFNKQSSSRDGHAYVCRKCAGDNLKMIRFRKREEVKRTRYRKGVLATRRLQQAVLNGKVEKEPCWFCGEKKVEGHHLLYEFALKVVWLCSKHHRQVHKEKSYE